MTRETTAGTCRGNVLNPPVACPGWSPQRAEWGQRVVCSCGREKWAHVPTPRGGTR